ncbi:MAG TPA: NAD(P) transhydrogenase subunit alpha [Candidatus Hydrogenedentes bacterium]|nr:NAD(P) transhydrogenase subunit alpha [Candidatus Hydrogenedentota bacterium]
MRIFVPKETTPGETRVPLVPETTAKLCKLGAELVVEAGLGLGCGYEDNAYQKAGAVLTTSPDENWAQADFILGLRKPQITNVAKMKAGSCYAGFTDPFTDFSLIDAFVTQRVSVIALEMLPRTTLAQKMDALSSQANLSGYVAVILAAERADHVLPMMMTPAGTLRPSKVFVIGCGVAGLQAVATAKRLGARVEAFDTRREVEEQVHSLGAKFVKADLGETASTKDGYAQALTPEQQEKQREAMAKVLAESNIVITTAQVFGRKAPVIVTEEMVKSMRPGSVIVDTAIETGGNVEVSRRGEEIEVQGVRVIALENLPGRVPVHASQMYSANLGNLVEHFWDKTAKAFTLTLDDEIMQGCLIVHEGQIRSERIKNARESAQ